MHAKYIVASAVVVLSIGCSSDNDSRDGAASSSVEMLLSDSNLANVQVLYGTWESGCQSEGLDTANTYTEWEFSSTNVNIQYSWYDSDDKDCLSVVSKETIVYNAFYHSDIAETSEGDAIMVDLTPVSYTDHYEVDSNIDGLPDDIVDEYHIFRVVNDIIFGGDFTTGNGESEESRPSELSDIYLTRKL